jgi:excisionase family DNA binding protein
MQSIHLLELSIEELELIIQQSIAKALESRLSENDGIEEILNSKEAANLVGISVSTLYKKTADHTIPHYKRGKKLYFKKQELIGWMTKDKVQTRSELRLEVLNNLPRKKSGL